MISKENSIFHLIISKGILSVSSVFVSFVLNLLVFDRVGSYQVFLISTSIASISPLLFSIPAGILSDKFKKSTVLICCDIISSFGILLIIYISSLEEFSSLLYFLSIIILSLSNEFRYTATTAIIPEISKKEMLVKYNGLQQFFRGASVVLGPALGILSYSSVNVSYVFLISIIIHLYSIFIMFFISKHENENDIRKSDFSFFKYKNILKWIFQQKNLKSILFIFSFFNALLTSYMSISTPYFLSMFGKLTLTLVVVFQGLGLIFASFFLIKINLKKINVGFFLSMFSIGVSIVLIALSKGWGVFFLSFLIGFCIGVISALNQSIWQMNTPQEIQGRVVAIRTMFLYFISPFFVYAIIPISDNYLACYMVDSNKIMNVVVLSIGVFITTISIFFYFKIGDFKNDS